MNRTQRGDTVGRDRTPRRLKSGRGGKVTGPEERGSGWAERVGPENHPQGPYHFPDVLRVVEIPSIVGRGTPGPWGQT